MPLSMSRKVLWLKKLKYLLKAPYFWCVTCERIYFSCFFFFRKIKSTALSSCFGFQEEIFVSVARTCLKCNMNTNFLNTEVMPVKYLKIKKCCFPCEIIIWTSQAVVNWFRFKIDACTPITLKRYFNVKLHLTTCSVK